MQLRIGADLARQVQVQRPLAGRAAPASRNRTVAAGASPRVACPRRHPRRPHQRPLRQHRESPEQHLLHWQSRPEEAVQWLRDRGLRWQEQAALPPRFVRPDAGLGPQVQLGEGHWPGAAAGTAHCSAGLWPAGAPPAAARGVAAAGLGVAAVGPAGAALRCARQSRPGRRSAAGTAASPLMPRSCCGPPVAARRGVLADPAAVHLQQPLLRRVLHESAEQVSSYAMGDIASDKASRC